MYFSKNESEFWLTMGLCFCSDFLAIALLFLIKLCRLFQYFVHYAVGYRFVSIHPVIPVEILHDFLYRLPAVLGKDLCSKFLGFQDFAGLDFDVRRRTLRPAAWLVDHYFRVRVNKALSLFSG